MKFFLLSVSSLLLMIFVSCKKENEIYKTPDYFPTKVNSYWAYGLQGGTAADSFSITVSSGTLTVAGSKYNAFTFDIIPPTGLPDSLFYKKAVVNSAKHYYEYFDAEGYFGFDQGTCIPRSVEYVFLKDNVVKGASWKSPYITGKINGVSYTIYIQMTLFDKVSVPTTVGSITSSDIVKVRYEYFSNASSSVPFYIEERWFAKEIGMIYNSFNNGVTTEIYKIGRYQVF